MPEGSIIIYICVHRTPSHPYLELMSVDFLFFSLAMDDKRLLQPANEFEWGEQNKEIQKLRIIIFEE